MKVARFIAVGILMIAAIASTHHFVYAQSTPAASSSPALPQGWDSSIPLPPDVVLLNSTVPKTGVVYAADFAAKGTYKELVDFYEKELPKANFAMGPKVAIAARKVYNRNFSRGGNLNSVVISPSTTDPSKVNIHFAWSSKTPEQKSSAP